MEASFAGSEFRKTSWSLKQVLKFHDQFEKLISKSV